MFFGRPRSCIQCCPLRCKRVPRVACVYRTAHPQPCRNFSQALRPSLESVRNPGPFNDGGSCNPWHFRHHVRSVWRSSCLLCTWATAVTRLASLVRRTTNKSPACNLLNWFTKRTLFATHSKNFNPAATSSHHGMSMLLTITQQLASATGCASPLPVGTSGNARCTTCQRTWVTAILLRLLLFL